MSTPFHTGKVQIGCKAEAPTRHEHHDRDALRLQSALLGNVARTDWDGIAIVVGLAALGFAAWVTA